MEFLNTNEQLRGDNGGNFVVVNEVAGDTRQISRSSGWECMSQIMLAFEAIARHEPCWNAIRRLWRCVIASAPRSLASIRAISWLQAVSSRWRCWKVSRRDHAGDHRAGGNGSAQGVASNPILVTMPAAAAAAEPETAMTDAELAPLAAIAPNGNGNGSGSYAGSRLS